ncbi:DUF4836 family protein [Alloprevotella rava]|uniref:DUF3352 domain-containing protein n=1 Tax=Alloprevotella rava TaxID=671218 RepID=A0A7W5XY52_9BACT|nr:DUF4836 family protein [Alloprevotella rava]MBB3703163.1 hypothetical protein [Alloprevotella rava]
MKKPSKELFTHIILPFIALTIVVIGIYYYFFAPKSYKDCIPDEAKAVVQIETQKAQEVVSSLAEYWGIQASGIDLTKPLYAFITPNEYIGFVAQVTNEQEIAANILRLFKEHKCMASRKNNNLNWTWLNAGWQMAWNSQTLMILGPGTIQEQDMLTQTISKLFDFRRSDSFIRTDKCTVMEKQEGDIKLFSTLDALPTPFSLLFRLDVPSDIDPSAFSLFAGINLGKSTQLAGEITSDTEETLAAYKAFECQNPPISQVHPSYISENSLFFLASRTKGNQLFELLRQDATFNQVLQGLNRTIEANSLLQNINGNTSLLITHLSKDMTPSFSLQAETSNKDLMSNAASWIEKAKQQSDVTLTKARNTYCLKSKEKELFFGQDKNLLFFKSNQSISTDKGKDVANEAIGCRQYFRVNLKELLQQPCVTGTTKDFFATIFKNHTTLTYKVLTNRKVTLEIK